MKRFLANEDGTALTEFVITLPVFITVFLGIVGLYTLQDAATRAHPVANRMLWTEAYAVATSEPDSRWGDPTVVSDYDRSKFNGDRDTFGYDDSKYMRLDDHGTIGEAVTGADFEAVSQWRFRQQGDSDTLCNDCSSEYIYNQDEARSDTYTYVVHATNDTGLKLPYPDSVEPEIAGMRALLAGGDRPNSRLAYGAGTRYGLVAGMASRSAYWKGIGATFSPQYQVVAPPRTMDTTQEARVSVATARVDMEATDFVETFGFETEDFYRPSARSDMAFEKSN